MLYPNPREFAKKKACSCEGGSTHGKKRVRKKRYPTLAVANDAIQIRKGSKGYREQKGKVFVVYECLFCGYYHIGHKREKKQKEETNG